MVFFLGLGYLTIDTLKSILLELEPNLGEEQLMEIVEEVDEDGSGTIDFDGEFKIKHLADKLLNTTCVALSTIISEFMGMMMG